MEELNEILSDLSKDDGNDIRSMDKAKIFYERFEHLFQKINKDCATGNRKSIKDISHIIDSEINRRTSIGEYGNPKKNNSLAIISSFKNKLRQCAFEIAKKEHEMKKGECECQMRLDYRLAPNPQTINKYGIATFVHGEEYLVYECKICQKKWVEENVGGGGVFISNWVEWKNDNYRLKKIFKDDE